MEKLHNHHMIPKCGDAYFPELYDFRHHPLFQVELTEEGHIDQHKILWQVFRHRSDKGAVNLMVGQRRKAEERANRVKLSQTVSDKEV